MLKASLMLNPLIWPFLGVLMSSQTSQEKAKQRYLRMASGVLSPELLCSFFPFNFGSFLKYILRAPMQERDVYNPLSQEGALNDYASALRYLRLSRMDLERMPIFLEQLQAYSPLASCFDNAWLHKAMPVKAQSARDFMAAFDLTATLLQLLVNESEESLPQSGSDSERT